MESLSDDEETPDQDKPMSGKSCFHVAQSLFPSTLCSAFLEVIAMLDDQAVSLDGTAVYEVAYQVRIALYHGGLSLHSLFRR